MAPSDVPWLGERLREERVRQGISLRGLARDVGVSASMISQIENGKTQPSVSTLYAITSALDMSVEALFTSPDETGTPMAAATAVAAAAAPAEQARAEGPPASVLEALGSFVGMGLGPLVRPDDRQVLHLDSGVTWERLGALPGHPVDFLLVTYAPGGTSSSTGGLMRHAGSEYGFLLRGELVLTLGFEEIHIRSGEAVSFDSRTPHGYRNDGAEPAVGVWFVLEEDH